MTITRLDDSHAAAFRQLRLQAMQTDPDSFLSTFEAEHARSLDDFAWEIRSSRSAPIYGYYGVFVEGIAATGHDAAASTATVGTAENPKPRLVAYLQLLESTIPKQKHIANLYNLYVAPEFRRQGTAAQLMNHVFAELKQHTAVELVFISCNSCNVGAKNFYEKLGFKQYASRPKSIKWQGKYFDEVQLMREV